MTEDEAEQLRIKLYEEDLKSLEQYEGNYAAHVNEDGDGWAVWNDESGAQVRKCGTRDEAVAAAHALNKQIDGDFGAE